MRYKLVAKVLKEVGITKAVIGAVYAGEVFLNLA